MGDDVYVEIAFLNVTWTFKGMQSIGELVKFLDKHASNYTVDGPDQPQTPLPAP
jgi:hypothetical protein